MRKIQFLLLCCVLLYCGGLAAEAQKVKTSKPQKQNDATATAEREIRGFFDAYAEDLRAARREAIADRYDRRGYFRVGNGNKTFVSFEDTKKRYLSGWTPPKSFVWKELSVEVLSPEAALVVGQSDSQAATGETRIASYSGLLIKDSGKWRIRVEDESISPLGFTTETISGDRNAPGLYKYRLKATPGASIGAHRHLMDMKIFVRAGRKFILMGDLETAKLQVFETGSTFVIPANTWHVEWWEAETIEEIELVAPMITERATPVTPRTP